MDGMHGKARYSPAVDVYSFAMVMFEIATGELPFYDNEWTAFEVRTEVTAGARPALPPSVTLPDGYVALMEACWAGNPHDRPTFGEVLGALDQMELLEVGEGAPPMADNAESVVMLSEVSQSRSL